MKKKKPTPFTGKRILIVEDNPTVARLIESDVERIGHISVGIVGDGVSAIEWALTQKPDLILMDIEMPKLDGLQATKIILDSYFVPIVILTSHGDQAMVEQASEAGAVAFLKKPPDIDEIQRAILMALARHEDQLELRRINRKLSEALDEINTLKGIVPICTSCKKVRDDKGYWEQVETYIEAHTAANVRQGLCPQCVGSIYADLVDDMEPYSKKDN